MKYRKPTSFEVEILKELYLKAAINEDPKNLDVCPMNDGGMGSLIIGKNRHLRKFSICIAEKEFRDIDGVLVITSLYLDQNKEPFELDVWRTDFSPTLALSNEILRT